MPGQFDRGSVVISNLSRQRRRRAISEPGSRILRQVPLVGARPAAPMRKLRAHLTRCNRVFFTPVLGVPGSHLPTANPAPGDARREESGRGAAWPLPFPFKRSPCVLKRATAWRGGDRREAPQPGAHSSQWRHRRRGYARAPRSSSRRSSIRRWSDPTWCRVA